MKVGQSTLWNWRRAVEGIPASDRLPALAPRRTGGGRKAELDDDLWTIFKSDYLRASQPTLASCYRRIEQVAGRGDQREQAAQRHLVFVTRRARIGIEHGAADILAEQHAHFGRDHFARAGVAVENGPDHTTDALLDTGERGLADRRLGRFKREAHLVGMRLSLRQEPAPFFRNNSGAA